MTMVSYAQNREDVVLDRAYPRKRAGFYVDVGASHPTSDSVTRHFYERGWHGINVEPATFSLELLREARPRDVNLGVGLARTPGEAVFYELPPQMTGASTFSAELANEQRVQGWDTTARTVAVTTLAAVCEEYVDEQTIDFLRIDVEGDEAEVLAGADFERFRPRVLVIEAILPGTTIPSHGPWEPSVLESRYRLALFDGLNRFYVREEDADLADVLAVPANVLDDYIAYPCLMWREQANEAAAALGQTHHALEETHDALEKTRVELKETRDALARADAALAPTREQLAKSQAALRDARVELAAARQALLVALRGRSVAAAP